MDRREENSKILSQQPESIFYNPSGSRKPIIKYRLGSVPPTLISWIRLQKILENWECLVAKKNVRRNNIAIWQYSWSWFVEKFLFDSATEITL